MELRAAYNVFTNLTARIVFLIDRSDQFKSRTITNDVDNVVIDTLKHYPGWRIMYKDSNNEWDELIHDGSKFLNFAPISREEKLKYNLN